jgi:hypothetical protein
MPLRTVSEAGFFTPRKGVSKAEVKLLEDIFAAIIIDS